jgi:hypothetical protein
MFNRMKEVAISLAVGMGFMHDGARHEYSQQKVTTTHDFELQNLDRGTFLPRAYSYKTGHKHHRASQGKRRKSARAAHGHQKFSARLRHG